MVDGHPVGDSAQCSMSHMVHGCMGFIVGQGGVCARELLPGVQGRGVLEGQQPSSWCKQVYSLCGRGAVAAPAHTQPCHLWVELMVMSGFTRQCSSSQPLLTAREAYIQTVELLQMASQCRYLLSGGHGA